MEREIKFMAWDDQQIKITEMPDGIEEHMDNQKKIEVRNNDISVFFDDYWGCKMLQYTGLKDKNGKEVYVDFAYKDSYDKIWIILDIGYCESVWCYRMKALGTGKIYPMDKSIKKFKYYGNIHENPELIK